MKKIIICIVVLALIAGGAAMGYKGITMLRDRDQDILTPDERQTEDSRTGESAKKAEDETEDRADYDSQAALTETSASGSETGGSGEDSYIDQVVALVNEERAKAGVAPLERSDALSAAAQVRARETVSSFSHTRPDGREFRTVLEENGIDYRNCGENIAMGYETPETVVEAWMNSEGHRANILSGDFASIGIGRCEDDSGQLYWVQLFMLER